MRGGAVGYSESDCS